MARKTKKPFTENRPTKLELETFYPVFEGELRNMAQDRPSASNGMVRIHLYRVTVELIPESNDVLSARLQELWDNCTSERQEAPLKMAARELGYELQGRRGAKSDG